MGTAAIARAAVGVEFKATGVEAVRRGARDITRETDRMQSKFGGSARQMAMAVENIARTGNASGEALKQIIAQGSEMALMFGAGGAITGAIGIGALAIYNYFDRARKEMIQTRITFLEELERMASGGDLVGLSRAQQFRFSGNPNALKKPEESPIDYLARRYGAQGVRARIEELRGQIPESTLRRLYEGKHMGIETKQVTEMRELLAALARLKRESAEAAPVVARLTAAEGERAKYGLKRLREAEAAKGADKRDALQMLAAMTGWGEAAIGGLKLRDPGSFGITGKSTPNLGRGNLFFSPEAVKASIGNIKSPVVDALESQLDDLNGIIRNMIPNTLGSAITEGFRVAFSGEGIGEGIKAFGRVLLGGLGSLFQQMGAVWITHGLTVMKLIPAMTNPLTSGPAMLAAGAAFLALGGALQGIVGGSGGGRGGGGGGGYSVSAASSGVIDRGLINPLNPLSASNVTPRTPIQMTNVIIGANDPSIGRQLKTIIRKADERGSL